MTRPSGSGGPGGSGPVPFGRYDLLDRISAGGMAEVFRAHDTRTGATVALKRILPQIAEDEEFIRMFEDEARIASQLEHPHIARTLDFGHVDQSYYIAFELVDGRDLRTLFDRAVRNRARPPLGILLYVFSRIAEGLSYAHSRRDADGVPVSIVHRDVSPQNIVISYDGDVKLIDFGIAKAAGKLSRTQVGTLKGKFGYMSPEQVRGNEVDHRADIFSLGICMWELLTLERLFNADNELLVLEKVRTAPIKPPSKSNPEVPAELDRIVLKALAKDVNERYRAAKDLYRDLNHFAQTTGTMATRDAVANYMQRAFPESAPERHSREGAAEDPGEIGGERSERFERRERRESHQRGFGEGFESVSSHKGRSQALVTDMEAEAHQETRAMAADSPSSDKRSDLDIFEGLGKKNTARPSAPPPPPRSSTAAPNAAPAFSPPLANPPPERGSQSGPAPGAPSSSLPSGLAGSSSGSQSGPPPGQAHGSPSVPPLSAPLPRDLVVAKKTLLGIPAPSGGTGASGSPSRFPTPPPRSAPPPPPGRGSLPQVVPPPPRAGTIPPPTGTRPGPIVVPASSMPKPSTANAGPKLDMDWDDEDEATHIFDKAGTDFEQLKTDRPRPAAGTPLAPPAHASPSHAPPAAGGTGPGSLKAQTLLGMNSPFGQPGSANLRASAPPPPPQGRGEGGLAFPHPPPTIDPSSIAAHTTSPGGTFAPAGSAPPPPPNPAGNFGQTQPMGHAMPAQVNTAPMPMPGPRGASPASTMPPPYQPPQEGSSLSQPGVPYPSPHAPNRMMEATQLVRPQASGRMGLVGMGVLFAALAAGLVIFLTMPRTGRIAINVADAKGAGVNHVEIFVDGTKHCDTAPCIVDQVSAGTHSLKVIAPGYEQPGDRAVTVEARKDAQIDFALTSTGQKSGTGIKITGNQSGVKLFVDGKEIGPLPQEIRDLTPGSHTIRLAGTDRYAALDKNVTIASDEMQDLGQQTLKVIKGKATITLGTPGAKVSIVSGTDRREFPTLPIAVDLDTSKAWALEASKPGFVDYHQVVSFDDGQAEKTFNIVLEPKGSAAAAAAPAAPAAPAFVASTPRATPTPKPAPPASEGNDAPAAASGDSFLNINSIPASSVVLDGKPIGNTPKVHIAVSPGAHTVLFVNAEQGLKKQISVSVAAGETKPAIAKLRE